MDLAAHGLWVGAAALWAVRQRGLSRRTAGLAVGMALLPDLVQLLPLLVWAPFGADGWATLQRYVLAAPNQGPPMAPWLDAATHHLHCVMHSAVVLGLVSLLWWAWRGRLWLPLLGWWAHVLIDVFTHSADFYPSPVLYPLSDWTFDGVAWNHPAFMGLNYLALAVAWWLAWRPPR